MSEAQYALAEVWASIDGKLEKFKQGEGERKQGGISPSGGYYDGYMCEAAEMIARLEKRGFTVTHKERSS